MTKYEDQMAMLAESDDPAALQAAIPALQLKERFSEYANPQVVLREDHPYLYGGKRYCLVMHTSYKLLTSYKRTWDRTWHDAIWFLKGYKAAISVDKGSG